MGFFQSEHKLGKASLPAILIAGAAVLAFTASAASAATTEVDLSSYVNSNFSIGQPTGQTVGNTGTSVSSMQFNLLDPSAGNNVWTGGSTGQSVDIKVNILDATQVTTLMNTLYGQSGLNTATVTFDGTGGATQSFTLVGNTDIRDYNNWVWTNSINGTTTQEWWTNNLDATLGDDDQSHRFDAQIFSLDGAFAGQTLTDIVITAGSAGGSYSEPFLLAADVTSNAPAGVPEPATWAMMLTGFFGMGALLRSRRQSGQALSA